MRYSNVLIEVSRACKSLLFSLFEPFFCEVEAYDKPMIGPLNSSYSSDCSFKFRSNVEREQGDMLYGFFGRAELTKSSADSFIRFILSILFYF